MKGTIVLRNPIKINGKKVKEITFDTEKITLDDYMAAVEKGDKTNFSVHSDKGAQLYFGFYAAIKENPSIDITDLQRVTGYDLMQFLDVGFLFTVGREDQMEEPSEETSETTQEDSAQAPQKSAKEA